MIEFLSAQTIVKTPDSASINPSDIIFNLLMILINPIMMRSL